MFPRTSTVKSPSATGNSINMRVVIGSHDDVIVRPRIDVHDETELYIVVISLLSRIVVVKVPIAHDE